MGLSYQPVIWNRQKKRYDLAVAILVLLILVTYIGTTLIVHPTITIETLIIRASALTAFILLHIILCIGPLCRLDPRFLPLLYNRRHLGVTMFLFALVHSAFAVVQFHLLGDTNAILSVFTSNTNYASLNEFPFQILGFLALIILLLMAASSHDFWLKNLSPRIWKSLHMMVYLAYFLVVVHVALGTLQYEAQTLFWLLLILGFTIITGLHLLSGWRLLQSKKKQKISLGEEGFYKVARIDEIQDGCGRSYLIQGEDIALFKYDGKLSAVSNICRHQMGPLGEGQIIDGCITCPWHGYQYFPENGQSPPPYEEKLSTYRVRFLDGDIWIHPGPLPEGTPVSPIHYKD